MAAWTQQMLDWVTAYYGDKVYFFLAIAAYIYLFISTKSTRKRIVYPCILILFLVLNPYLYAYVYSRIIYWRLLWMLPNGIVIAYAAVSFIEKRKHKITKIIWLAAFAVCIVLKGTNVYTHSGMVQAQNEQHLSSVVKNVCDYILMESEQPRCIMPREWYSQVRQYSGDIEMMYGRNADGYINTVDDMSKRIADELAKETPDFGYVFGQAFIQKYEFVVVHESKPVTDAVLQQYGYDLQTTVDGYNIYYHANIEDRKIGGWVVTQYGPNAGTSICYTIEDENNNLIIIDGGYAWYENRLRAIIQAHGNHVTAWIVTSPRDANAHAFCEIMQDLQGIQVDNIYTMKIDDEQFEKYVSDANEWQRCNVVGLFREVVSTLDQVNYVNENDEFELLGLKFKILHVWNEETDEQNQWQEYNGSICFTIEGSEEKMLFLSNLTKPMECYVYERHKEDIDVDFVQVNNNGEWYFSGEFYDATSPQIAFMDCGYATMNSETTDYHAWDVYNFMLSRGAAVYSYETVPNWVILK